MMEQRLTSAQRIDPIPQSIDSFGAKLVYLYLDVAGPAVASEMNDVLEMKTIEILSVLRSLEDRSLVARTDDGYVTVR